MTNRLVDIDKVLDLFGISDEDIYAIHTIEDALYDKSLPIVDPVKHGHWINHTREKHICSECQNIVYAEWCVDNEYEYCPFCGAKMDERREDANN